ncbi:unnamed protein product [Sphenostylis stenocarpa]|uniref:TATA-box-binding protein n=1 Tax=Sphenostylis stenocarpa TaxID=92480 RepID=A0AA86VAN9_9FABA|nr:unnamed protein product [Sphenostylis stenocarpa]
MADQGLEGSQPVDLQKHPSGIVPTLQYPTESTPMSSVCTARNIVSTVKLDCKLDLKTIALQARNAEYNPKAKLLRFAAVIMRIRDPETTALIFASGKMYEPELFPGLIYRMKQPKIVLLIIFVSGKIVLTRAKVRDETYTAFENIHPICEERAEEQWSCSEVRGTVNIKTKEMISRLI